MLFSSFILILISFFILFLTLIKVFPGANHTAIFLFILIISLLLSVFGKEIDDLLDEQGTTPIFRVIKLSISSLILTGILIILLRLTPLRDKESPPALSPPTESKISEIFETLPRGMFAFSCPKGMTVGITEQCTARVANERYIASFRESFRRGMNKDLEEIRLRYVSSEMNVKLTGKTFDIKPQEDGGNQPIIDRDFTSWQWDVTPQEEGMQRLKFLVSVILKVPGYRELPPKRYEENVIEVNVRVNPAFSTKKIIKQYWKYLLAISVFMLSVFGFLLFNKKYPVFATRIVVGKIDSVNANNNDGVINILAVSQDIKNHVAQDVNNAIADLPASNYKQPGIKELLETLRQLVEYNPELSDKQKEDALEQVKKLSEAAKEQAKSDFQESVGDAITMLKEIVSGASSVGVIFKLLTEIVSLFGLS